MTAHWLLLFSVALAPVLFAGQAQSLVAQGNAAWRAKQHEEAILLYQKAVVLRPKSAEAAYNLGTALYRLYDYARALDEFEHAARLARKGSRVAALARHNAGNCAFQQSLTLVRSDARGALKLMEHAFESFLDAVRLDAGLADAAHNAEVARKWLKLLEQQAAQSQNQAAADGKPEFGDGPGSSAQDILGLERMSRFSGNAKGRIPAVDKDW